VELLKIGVHPLLELLPGKVVAALVDMQVPVPGVAEALDLEAALLAGLLGKGEEAAESFETVSEWMTTSIDEWVEKISYEERRLFVEDMFSALMAGGASTVQEVTGKGFIRVVSAAATSSPTSKKLILDLASEAIAAGRKKDDKNGDHA
ncbi:MAG: hypothetical protein IJ130_11360, partial [Solobacterium sp.]|nr:hypothetical protein [Solobacterium sp.]